MTDTTPRSRSARLNIRTTVRQDALIREAAEAQGKNVSEFVLEAATAAAQNVLMDQRAIFLSEESWREFTALIDRPARVDNRLVDLMRLTSDSAASR